jgi:hypothetical protein
MGQGDQTVFRFSGQDNHGVALALKRKYLHSNIVPEWCEINPLFTASQQNAIGEPLFPAE